MKYIFTVSLVFIIFFGCSDRNNFPRYRRLAGVRPFPTNTDSCSENDIIRLARDFNHCGACDNECDLIRADRCFNGCRCGNNLPCSDDRVCRSGRCVRADRYSACETNADCNGEQTTGSQTCIMDSNGQGTCMDSCEFDAECPAGFACVQSACTFLSCVPEICDNVDNDCDGFVDENENGSGPLSRWCFSGPDTNNILPPCQRGTQVCESGGVWSECANEIAPIPESGLLACNSRDDDCDGCIDGTLQNGVCVQSEPNGFDVVYLIDISGSMSTTIAAVRTASATFASQYSGNSEFRFALVLFPGLATRNFRAFVEHDFSDFASFNQTLSTISAAGGGEEPSWDAVYESATDEIAHGVDTNGDGLTDAINENRRGLSWRSGSIRIMIMFTDEHGQSYRASRGLQHVNETTMCNSLSHGESLTVFTHPSFEHDFNDCAQYFPISRDPNIMVEHLRTIITNPCL